METYPYRSPSPAPVASGFSLVETMVAVLVLSIGLLSVAALSTKMVSGTSQSHYMSLAADLASEKLEDLNRWPSFDPNVYAASGSTEGSLSSDTSDTVTSGGIGPELVDYYDDVSIADSNGAISETISITSGGSTSFKTTTHNSDGTVTTTTTTSAPSISGSIEFHRRWTIEMDQPVTGVRRITVLVSLPAEGNLPAGTYQMTTVRP